MSGRRRYDDAAAAAWASRYAKIPYLGVAKQTRFPLAQIHLLPSRLQLPELPNISLSRTVNEETEIYRPAPDGSKRQSLLRTNAGAPCQGSKRQAS
jgi:hypothetical protein